MWWFFFVDFLFDGKGNVIFLMRIEKGFVWRNLLIRGLKFVLVLVWYVDDSFCLENMVMIFYLEDYFLNICYDSYLILGL